MARTANRTPEQARIARLVRIRQQQAHSANNAVRAARNTAPMNAMLAACIAAAGFEEHAAR